MFRGKFKKKSNLNILSEKLLEATQEPRTEVKLEPKIVQKDKPLKFINFKSLLTS